MPSSIPYDPSLVLTSVVSEKALANVEQIAAAQAPVDAAQDSLNSFISAKRSLRMTQTELRNLGVDTKSLDDELEKINTNIDQAASTYAKEKVAGEVKIMQLRKNIRMVHANVESPVDYMKTEIKTMPLAADTMNMDVQYFSYDSNSQNASTYSSQIAAYVSKSAGSVFGPKTSFNIGGATASQVSQQVKTHRIEGTLVISVTCTHKNAHVLAPFHIHVDKAIKVWNRLFPGDKFDPTKREQMMKIAMNEGDDDKKKFSIISGTTFGSSFIGMVHILNSTNTQVAESLTASAMSLQAQMNSGAWFSNASGKTGVDKKFASAVKNLLSQQNVTSHVTVLSMGVIPSMVANSVARTVEQFTKFSPEENMRQVAVIQNSTDSARATVESQAQAARTGGQVNDAQNAKIESSLSALAAIDGEANKILDINSMMTALDDYLKKAADLTGGVPINYYLKDFDKKMLAEMWAAKYYPGEFMSIKYDDSEGAGPTQPEKAKL